MWNVFWERVLRTNGGDANVGGFASFGEGIVARVEIFALLLEDQTRCRRFGILVECTLSLF